MKIIEIEKVLNGADGSALTPHPLTALEPRHDPYLAMLCQPRGTLKATAAHIGNADPTAAAVMFRRFLETARDRGADLVVTPEYSVPWSILDDILSGRLLPPVGALWALGCESISPAVLDTLQARFQQAAQPTRLIHEPFDDRERKQKAFVDPLLYLFWARNDLNQNTLCAVVQFKTIASKDSVETVALYPGTYVYKFNSNKIGLLGIICSDAFEFINHVGEHQHDLLLLHVQLNQQPGHDDYSAYRRRLFSIASGNRIEIVCLNWAVNVTFEGNATPWNKISGSAWYVGPNALKAIDAEVEDLHRSGVYYSIVNKRWHGFYLNWQPHALILRKAAVFSEGAQVLNLRLAPQVIGRLKWDAPNGQWSDEAANDGFDEFLATYPLDGALPIMCKASPLAVERALELLVGPTAGPSDWFTIPNLDAISVDIEESIRRVTVSQETDVGRAGVKFRRDRGRKAKTAVELPNDKTLAWPASLADLAKGFQFSWEIGAPHCNVRPLHGTGTPATLVYLGENPETDVIDQTYAKLHKAVVEHAVHMAATNPHVDLNAARARSQDRLCVVVKRNQKSEVFRPANYASYTEPGDTVPGDIAGSDA